MMKKINFLVLSFIFSVGSMLAQGKPSFGFKAGVNFVNLESASDVSLGQSTGFHVGVALAVPLVKKSGLQAEAFYSAEGIEDIDLAYINLPLMYTYKIIPGLRLQVGPQFKLKVNADVSLNEGLDADAENEALEDDFKDLNFDLAAGLEYKLPVIGIFFQARALFGLNDTGEDNYGKSQSIQLSAGYRF